MKRSWLIVCLVNFCIAVIMGVLMRLAYVIPIDFNYGYLLHAHSHTVILGWCYLAVYGFLVHQFLSKEEQEKPIYNRLFWITEVAVVGMMVSFPFQGYAFFSILFSTLHIFCSYYAAYLLWKHHQKDNKLESKTLKTALAFMILSTFGVWCLGPAVACGAKDSAFYNSAIQFFLHFQFNGWFVLAVLMVFCNYNRKLGIVFNSKLYQRCLVLYIIGLVLTFALPLGWFYPYVFLKWCNTIGVLLQLLAIYYFFKMLLPALKPIKQKNNSSTFRLYQLALICLVIKILLQVMTIVPEIALVAHSIRNLTVGFIHLIMIGIVNTMLFSFITTTSYFDVKRRSGSLSIGVFLIGFIVMELLLFVQGYCSWRSNPSIPNFAILIMMASLFIAIGLFLLLHHLIKIKK